MPGVLGIAAWFLYPGHLVLLWFSLDKARHHLCRVWLAPECGDYNTVAAVVCSGFS